MTKLSKKKSFLRGIIICTVMSLMFSILPVGIITKAGDPYMIKIDDATSLIDTIATSKPLFSDTATYNFSKVPANINGITYVKSSFTNGCQATVTRPGYVYIITPVQGDNSQADTLLKDGYEELAFNFPVDFYTGIDTNSPHKLYYKYVLTDAKIQYSKWGLLVFSEQTLNFKDVLKPTNSGTVQTLNIGTKLWGNQAYTVNDLPSCLTGKTFVSSATMANTYSTATKMGYAYVITPALGQTNSLASGLKTLLYEKIDIPSWTLYAGQTFPIEVYGKIVTTGDNLNFGNWGLVVFSEEQIAFTSNATFQQPMAVIDPPAGYNKTTAAVGATIFSNQSFVFNFLPDFLKGKHYICGPMTGNYAVTVKKAGYVYVVTPIAGQAGTQEAALLTSGFAKLDIRYFFRLYLTETSKLGVYGKYVEAGTVLQYGNFAIVFGAPELGVGTLATYEATDNSKITEFKPQARLFRDRNYFIKDTVPNALVGKSLVLADADIGATVTVKTAGYACVITPVSTLTNSQEATLLADGYEKLSFPSFVISDNVTEVGTIFTKYVTAGQTIHYGKWNVLIGETLPQQDYYVFASDTPAQVLINPGESYSAENRNWQGCPSIETTTGGRYWSTWFTGGTAEPQNENYGTVSFSDDNAQTWTDHAIVVKHSDPNVRVEDTQFWKDPQGRLWLFWCQSYCIPNRKN